MQDGAVSILSRHLSRPYLSPTARAVFTRTLTHLLARDESAWTCGQWMTERPGGSDVSGTETLATYSPIKQNGDFESSQIDGAPLGPWVIDGFKWFSSA